eukprot:Mrub_01715.p1 GENE.Mrub_01715~~Mrub_01715.p1  ORF type:complete len:661 (+),score=94.06 Mrub_01715:225-1985(+)
MLNNPKDEYINNDGRLEKLERKNLLNKNGLGSLPDQNMFHKKDMNQSDSKVDQLMIHHNEVENILSDNIDEDTDYLEVNNEVNKAMQLVKNISDQSLNNEEKSRVKGESSNIFNYLFGFWFKRKKTSNDDGDYEQDLQLGYNSNQIDPQNIDRDEFMKMKAKFMSYNNDNVGDYIDKLDKEFSSKNGIDPKVIDENMMDARSIHSYEDSSDSEQMSDSEFNCNLDIYQIEDDNLVECIDLDLIKKQKKLPFRNFEELISGNNFFENKYIRVIVNSNGEEKVHYPLTACAHIMSILSYNRQLNKKTNKKITEKKYHNYKQVLSSWRSQKSYGYNGEIDTMMSDQSDIICSLYPTQEDLLNMNLKYGRNKLEYVCEGIPLHCNIFLYKHDDRLIISDVDGTITKSDILGHLCYFLGKDWTHKGITGLYDLIVKNGYKIIYLTSRPISYMYKTKDLIFEKIRQNEIMMPSGPVITSPNGLRDALYNEVINKTPYRFKIDVLSVIRTLFEYNPFYGGFGNKVTDYISYTAVGCKLDNIFIINPKSEINYKQEIITYESLSTRVDEFFIKFRTDEEINEDINQILEVRDKL